MDSIENLKEQINNFNALLNYGGLLNMDKEKISELRKKIHDIEVGITDLTKVHKNFNSIFSERGWITYDSISTDLMKQAINTFETSDIDRAEEVLLEHYEPEKLKHELIRLKAVPEIVNRYKFIDYAFNDYIESKYYSVIPLLLMVIDGSVQDVISAGFHSGEANFDVWDSIICDNEGIDKIRDIFKKGRRKTTQEVIDLPYRNGILHGVDLGYDNYKVAAKCWHFLFIIRDWILSKKSEDTRKAKFEEENRTPTFTELAEKFKSIEETKSAIREWEPREISKEYIDTLNLKKSADVTLPENVVIEFLNWWVNKNYGYMAKLYSKRFYPDLNKKILAVREQFENSPINSFKISSIIDKGSGMSEIIAEARKISGENSKYIIRLLYEGSNNIAIPRSFRGGDWKIRSVQEVFKI